MQETPLLDLDTDLGAEAVGRGCLVGHDEAAGLLHGGLDRVNVPRDYGLQVDDLARDAICSCTIRSGLQARDLRSPADQRDVGALADGFGLAEGQLVVAHRYVAISVLEDVPVQHLGLEEQHRIWVTDGCQQEALGLFRTPRNDNLETRAMGKVGFHALAVVHAAVADGRAWRSDDNVSSTAAGIAVPVLGDLVHDLIEGRENVVRELHLCDGRVSGNGQSDREASDCLLSDRCIHHPALTELFAEAHRGPEDATERDILTEDDRLGILLHGNGQGIVDRCDHRTPLRWPGRLGRHLPGPREGTLGIHRRKGAVEVTVPSNVVVAAVLTDVLFAILPLLLQVPRQVRVDVREALLQRGALLRLSLLEGIHDVSLCLSFQCNLLAVVPQALCFQVLAPPRDGADGLPCINLLGVLDAIGLGIVRGRVVAHAVGHELKQHRGLLLDSQAACLLRGGVHGNEVVAVHTHGGDAKGGTSACNAISTILVLDSSRYRVAIVAANEQSLRSVDRSKVQTCQRIALRSCTIAEVRHGDPIFTSQLVCITCARCLRDVRPKHCMDGLHILLEQTIVDL
mmetsp:Transcript_147276/g.473090  ORF Transcript_147276/g.473090 Transcript_147276/m.473090 type:complete len:570 (+) Transcript_147276:395-2104(+)